MFKVKNKKMNLKRVFRKIFLMSSFLISSTVFALNINAKEFKPVNKFKNIEKFINEKIFFDNLEKEFVENNEWLFYL
jgi:hypothetical protein